MLGPVEMVVNSLTHPGSLKMHLSKKGSTAGERGRQADDRSLFRMIWTHAKNAPRSSVNECAL